MSETVGPAVDPRQQQPTYPTTPGYTEGTQQPQWQQQAQWQQQPPIPTQMTPPGWPPAPVAPRRGPIGLRPPPQRSRKPLVMVGAATLVLAVAGSGFALAGGSGTSPDTRYLQALRAQGMGGQFSSDAVALAHGHAICTGLKGGAADQGSAVDQVGVQFFCPSFSSGFHVLEKADVQGKFELDDPLGSYSSSPGIGALDDGSCTGIGGFNDIGEGTTVVVKNDSGKTLTTTSLGAGAGDDTSCIFSFDFPITEGSSDYVVSVSHRGDQHYSFTTLQNDGVSLSLSG